MSILTRIDDTEQHTESYLTPEGSEEEIASMEKAKRSEVK
jgi:hypothetical protein